MLGISDAAHREYSANGTPFITTAHCEIPEPGAPKIGGMRSVRLRDGTRARSAYGVAETKELFACSFELNRDYYGALERAGMGIVGVDDEDGARVVEVPGHPFYVATLFLPQMVSRPDRPHPLFLAYIRSVMDAASRSRPQRLTRHS